VNTNKIERLFQTEIWDEMSEIEVDVGIGQPRGRKRATYRLPVMSPLRSVESVVLYRCYALLLCEVQPTGTPVLVPPEPTAVPGARLSF
jgi:hypothetical protein